RILLREVRIVLREPADQSRMGLGGCRPAEGLLRQLEVLFGTGSRQCDHLGRLREVGDQRGVGLGQVEEGLGGVVHLDLLRLAPPIEAAEWMKGARQQPRWRRTANRYTGEGMDPSVRWRTDRISAVQVRT